MTAEEGKSNLIAVNDIYKEIRTRKSELVEMGTVDGWAGVHNQGGIDALDSLLKWVEDEFME